MKLPADAPADYAQALATRFASLVWTCLDQDLPRSAVFYAERYFALDQANHEARHLYATALLRAGQTHSALCSVNQPREARCTGCEEIRAKCLTTLGRFREAREALELSLSASKSHKPSPAMGSRTSIVFPEEAALHTRAGTMAANGKIYDKAAASFRKALALNPMLWEAFEGLCSLGSIPDIDDLFPARPLPTKRTVHDEPQLSFPSSGSAPVSSGTGFFTPVQTTGANPFQVPWPINIPNAQPFRIDSLPDTSLVPDNSFAQYRNKLGPYKQAQLAAPQVSVVPAFQPTQPAARPLSSAEEGGPVQKRLRSQSRRGGGANGVANGTDAPKGPSAPGEDAPKKPKSTTAARAAAGAGAVGAKGAVSDREQPPRRSTRLLGGTNTRPTLKSPPRERKRPAHGRTKSAESEMEDDGLPAAVGQIAYPPSPPGVHSDASQPETAGRPLWTAEDEATASAEYGTALAEYEAYELMRQFARAMRALALYDTQGCLNMLGELPPLHQRTPWVMSMVGKAHYERTEYAAAERAFLAVRSLEPYRVWDMEVYSTLLWYLQKPVQLSFLAQELLAIDPRAPEAWIAVGNTFSAQKERAQATTCFRRAAQLNPSCAYAYTLCGHESVDEDPDKAMHFFQSALRADPRHYNAWYGLGSMYMKRNKVRLAEYHYRKALDINPHNAVILGCMGMAVERRGDREGALVYFDEAVRRCPENALVRYHRAKLYIAMRQYKRAVADLVQLRDATPDEANVVFQLAKVYRLLGDELKSAQLLAAARDLSPKSIGKIRKLLETVKDEEAADEEMDEG